MPYVKASPYCGVVGDIQLGGNVIHGVWIVSFVKYSVFTIYSLQVIMIIVEVFT